MAYLPSAASRSEVLRKPFLGSPREDRISVKRVLEVRDDIEDAMQVGLLTHVTFSSVVYLLKSALISMTIYIYI